MKAKIILILTTLLALGSVGLAQERCEITKDTPPVVSAAWLKEHIDHQNLVTLHVGRKADYDKEHIPGALHIATSNLSLPHEEGGLALQLPPVEALQETLEKYGIGNDSRIILYFGKDWVTSTTRIYFTLDYLGLRDNTSVLDGGMAAWVAAGNKLTSEVSQPKRKSLKVKADSNRVAESGWMVSKLSDSNVKFIDARASAFYDGTRAGGYPRPGHILGAKNIPYTSIVDKDLKFRPDSELKALFEKAGIKPYDTIVTYCHIGQQASLAYFAARKLGYKVKLYDGSFEEWSADESLAVFDPRSDERGTTVQIVTPEWVAKNGHAKDVKILDVRLNVYDYFAGHVPNAVHLADAAMRGPKGGYPTQYLESFMIGRLFSQAGVSKGDKVVVYSDGSGVLGATMMIYLLERYGHKNVYFVDGGYRDFKASQETSQQYPETGRGRFDSLDNKKVSATLKDVKASIGKKGVVFIDARPPDVYRGEKKIWARNGHIPGAINIPWVRLMEENNRHKLKPTSELRRVFADAGVTPNDDIIVYCGTSREASLEYMILKHILKVPKVRLYEGSWAEYSNHKDLKVETGPGNSVGK